MRIIVITLSLPVAFGSVGIEGKATESIGHSAWNQVLCT